MTAFPRRMNGGAGVLLLLNSAFALVPRGPHPPPRSGRLAFTGTGSSAPLMTTDEEERRIALRLPDKPPPPEPNDHGDPLGGGDADIQLIEQAQFRVKRRADAGEYAAKATSRSLPLVSLLAQVGFGSGIFLGLGYCWLVRLEAEAGTAWAVEALANSDAWWPAPARLIFDRPPGGPLVLLYAGANGLNAVRCLPLLIGSSCRVRPTLATGRQPMQRSQRPTRHRHEHDTC